jgi:p-cumate 2,3-dioxygenase subunit alpha
MNVAGLIDDRPDVGLFRVHRAAMTAPEVFALERERIFPHCWLYAAHESELPRPGDYLRRLVGGRPIFLVRGHDGVVRCFYNSCTHRGALVCRQDSGNAQQFQCFYHAWTFNARGELIGVPGREGYSEAFDPAALGLGVPPGFANYHGLYFVCYDPAAEHLESYLGDARELLDLSLDAGDLLGGWTVLPGSSRFSIRANWKLLVENSLDSYHVAPLHQTYLEYQAHLRTEAGVYDAPRSELLPRSRGLALNGRHGATFFPTLGRTIANPSRLWDEEAYQATLRIRDRLCAEFGPARGELMANTSRFLLIFPNFSVQDTGSGFRLRLIQPVAPDRLDVQQWEMAPRDELPSLRRYRADGVLEFQGPGGFATPDDMEALESCQLGFQAAGVEWSDVSRGMKRTPRDDDELGMRTWWRQWHAMLLGRGRAAEVEEYAAAEPSPLSPV